MTDIPPRIVLATPSPTNAPPRLTLPAPTGSAFVTPVLRGLRGPAGGGGSGGSTAVFGEVPSGTGSTLTLGNGFQPGSTCVYRNGLREVLDVGYSENSPTITLSAAPLSSDVITVDYLIAT